MNWKERKVRCLQQHINLAATQRAFNSGSQRCRKPGRPLDGFRYFDQQIDIAATGCFVNPRAKQNYMRREAHVLSDCKLNDLLLFGS